MKRSFSHPNQRDKFKFDVNVVTTMSEHIHHCMGGMKMRYPQFHL